VEAAERLFERAPVGASTENVALGRLADGTEMLRIGRVNRPEMAAWRYGDRLLGRWKRHRRQFWMCVGGGAALGAIPMVGRLSLWTAGAAWGVVGLILERRALMRTRDGELVRRGDASKALFLPAETLEGWRLLLPRGRRDSLELSGREALRALRGMLPRLNPRGGSPEQIRNSVDEIERLESPARVLREVAGELEQIENMTRWFGWPGARPGRISTAHPVIQLALEMVVNEETERRALGGELSLLEREWREAEELAVIADDLLLPEGIRERIRRLKTEASR
jgi:hypothetical protein